MNPNPRSLKTFRLTPTRIAEGVITPELLLAKLRLEAARKFAEMADLHPRRFQHDENTIKQFDKAVEYLTKEAFDKFLAKEYGDPNGDHNGQGEPEPAAA